MCNRTSRPTFASRANSATGVVWLMACQIGHRLFAIGKIVFVQQEINVTNGMEIRGVRPSRRVGHIGQRMPGRSIRKDRAAGTFERKMR